MPKFEPTPHPILPVPSAAAAYKMGERKWMQVVKRREEIIKRETSDPLRFGWEPYAWKIADALLEWPWIDKLWAAAVRKSLGFAERVAVLYILGGNMGGKTEYAAKRLSRLIQHI